MQGSEVAKVARHYSPNIVPIVVFVEMLRLA